MKYAFIKQIIDLAEQFEQEHSQAETPDLIAFTAWLNSYIINRQASQKESVVKMVPYETVDSVLSKLITFLYRYARNYSKKALENTPLHTFDDFTYLVGLFGKNSMTKMELIDLHMHEKTTGIEIIKRLLKNQLAEQYDDKIDKRSKRMVITSKGRELLLQIFPRMSQVATLVGGDLGDEEKMHLLYLLNKLHLFHNPIYHQYHDCQPEQIMAEKLPEK